MTLVDSDLTNYLQRETKTITSEYNKPKSKSYLSSNAPLSDDTQLIGYVKDLFYKARDARKPLVSKWDKAYNLMHSRSGASFLPQLQSWLPKGHINEIYPIIAANVGWMTDRRITYNINIAAEPFSPFAHYWQQVSEDLETVMDSTFKVNTEEAELCLMLWDACQYGTGILKTLWDNTLAGGIGDAITRRVDLYGFYPDPAAKSLHDGNYYIEVKDISIQELDRRFPGAAEKLGIGQWLETIDEMPTQYRVNGRLPRANPAAITGTTGPNDGGSSGRYGLPGISRQHANTLKDDGTVTVIEAWLRDHEITELKIHDEEQGEYTELCVFDTWRVVVIAGNKILLNEQAKNIWSHGQHPYSRHVPVEMGEFWGIGLVDLLAPAQELLDALLSATVQSIQLTGNPILLEDRQAGTSRKAIGNKPGIRIEKNRGGEITWLTPPPMRNDIPQLTSYILQRMEALSGLTAITKGGAPPGRNAEGVIDSLQEAAFVRIRMHLRNLEYTLQDAGNKKASLIIENYNIPRMVAITGPQGRKSTLALRARHFMTKTEKGALPLNYQLQVSAGANQDTSRRVREDLAMTLFTMGAIDDVALLEAVEFPNYQVITARIADLKARGMFQPPGARQRR